MIITGVEVVSPGSGFKVGDIFTIKTSQIKGIDTIVKVKSVYPGGGVKSVDIIKYGIGHSTLSSTLVFNSVEYLPLPTVEPANYVQVDPDTELVLHEMTNGGPFDVFNIVDHGFVTGDTVVYEAINATKIYGLQNFGQYRTYVVDEDTFAIAQMQGTPIQNYLINMLWIGEVSTSVSSSYNLTNIDVFDNPPVQSHNFYKLLPSTTSVSFNINGLVIKLVFGNVCIYPGYYMNGYNLLDDQIYIQDSFYYQAFSYVTALNKSIEEYGAILKDVLHPAGTKHFARYDIEYQSEMTTEGEVKIVE